MKVYLTQKLSISEIFGYKTNFKNIDVFVNDFCGNIDILTSFGGFIVQSIFEKFPFSLRKEKVCLFAYSFYSGYLQVTLIFYCVFVTKSLASQTRKRFSNRVFCEVQKQPPEMFYKTFS